jgi:hypothetical protein
VLDHRAGLALLAELEKPIAQAAKDAFRNLSAAEIDTTFGPARAPALTCTAMTLFSEKHD